MDEFYLKSIDRRWKKEIAKAQKSITFLSPYLTSNTANLVFQKSPPEIITVCTVFSFKNFVTGASSVKTLIQLKNMGIRLLHLDSLHAKILTVDDKFASVGSQNLTFGGTRNKEASIIILEKEKILQLSNFINNWLEKSIEISEEMLTKAENYIIPFQEKMHELFLGIDKSEKEYWYKVQLEEMQKKIPRVYKNLRNFSSIGSKHSIDEMTACYFIEKSAWWLKHPSYPVRAPNHKNNVYGSNPDWRIDFGANTFLVGRAIQRCLDTIETAIKEISQGQKVTLASIENKMRDDIRSSIANFEGDEYHGYYSALENNDIIFGTQSIDMKDFITCINELTDFRSIFDSDLLVND